MKHTKDEPPRNEQWKKYRIIVLTLVMYAALFASHFLLLHIEQARSMSYDYSIPAYALKTLSVQYLLAAATAAFLFYISRRPPVSRSFRLAELLVFLVPGVILCTPTPQYLILPNNFSFIGIWDPAIGLHDSAFVYLGGAIVAGGVIRFFKYKVSEK